MPKQVSDIEILKQLRMMPTMDHEEIENELD